MAGFPKKKRQAIIDGYLAATGRNMFVPAEFVDWLEGQPDHEAHDWFFGMDDAEAARRYRVELARQMASGLRIAAPVSTAPSESKTVKVATREYPAMISPAASRRQGGGYVPFDPEDDESMAELQRQAGGALRSWLNRYRGAAEAAGLDVSGIERTALVLLGEGEQEAA